MDAAACGTGLVDGSSPWDATAAGDACRCGDSTTGGLAQVAVAGRLFAARACTLYAGAATLCCCDCTAVRPCGAAGAAVAGRVGGSGGSIAAPCTSNSCEAPAGAGAAVPGRFSRPLSEPEVVRMAALKKPGCFSAAGGVAVAARAAACRAGRPPSLRAPTPGVTGRWLAAALPCGAAPKSQEAGASVVHIGRVGGCVRAAGAPGSGGLQGRGESAAGTRKSAAGGAPGRQALARRRCCSLRSLVD